MISDFEWALIHIAVLSDAERDELFKQLRQAYCLDCGSDDPGCQCWNDE